MTSQRSVSIAVVGSGLAGLTAAYLLTQRREAGLQIEVHLFEQASALGMDSHSVSVDPASPEECRIDVPMRSFQGGYYKQLIALYHHLGVKFNPADFSYSFSFLTQRIKSHFDLQTYFIYNGSSGLRGASLPYNGRLPGSLANSAKIYFAFVISTILILTNYIRISILSAPCFRPKPSVTFREWVARTTPRSTLARWARLDAAWCDFVQNVLVPMFSAVCTAPEEDVYAHPVSEFLDYIWLTLGAHHYVVQHGVRDVVSRLSRDIQCIHLSSPVVSIELDPSDTSTFSIRTPTETYKGFSHLILATQANNALSLLSSYHSSLPKDAPAHRQAVEQIMRCLESFQYRRTVVVNHKDSSLLPPDQRDQRDLNLVVRPCRYPNEKEELDANSSLTVSSSYTMATQVLRQPLAGTPLYQTTNPITPPLRDHVLSVSVLGRAVVTVKSKQALRGLSERHGGWWPFTGSSSSLGHLQGAGRIKSSSKPGIWICGAYAHGGIPLLEGCVASARDVVEQGILRSEGVVVRDTPC